MRITIAGAGRVGTHLAKYLSGEHQDITVVDEDPAKLAALDSDFNLLTVEGNPMSFSALREANAAKADLFIAVTPVSAENIVACATAHSMGAKRTVARVDRYDYIDRANAEVMRRMGVDTAVFPEFLAGKRILSALEHSWSSEWYEFYRGEIIMVGVRVDTDAPIVGHELKDYISEKGFHVSAVRRNHASLIPRGDFRAEAGDMLFITTTRCNIGQVREEAGKVDHPVRKVIIAGGNLMAELTARHGASRFSFTIIEKDPERCRQLARSCPHAAVVCGDAGDNDVLLEAGFATADAFVALSDGAAGTIIACITASEGGVTKTIAEIEREQYIPKAEAFGIGTIINKQLIASNTIFQLMIDADSSSSKCLALPDADVARMTVRKDSFLTSAPVKDLRLPPELTFAGMIRGGKGFLVVGGTRFEPGDQVLVFCLSGALHKVEKLFNR